MLPKIKRCPCCNAINLFQVNGIAYENKFKSLIDWTLKRTIVCRKCGIEFGLFINNKYKKALEQIVWMDILKCSDDRIDELNKLQNKELRYIKTLKEIECVLNQIREAKINVKIKAKIKNINMVI